MGISVDIVPASDAEILGFRSDACALRERFGAPRIGDASYLTDLWDGLDFVLTAESGDALPLGAIKRGDVVYPNAGVEESRGVQCRNYHFDECHAIFAATTKQLALELSGLSEATLRCRFDPAKMRGESDGRLVYPGRLWLPLADADSVFRELMFYFNRLRRCVSEAAAADLGLLFYRYEDW
jgi:hypothetical protein